MSEQAIKDIKETVFDVLKALVANSYQVSAEGTFPVVQYTVTTQKHGEVLVTTVVERLNHYLYISFVTPTGTRRYSIARDGSVTDTFTQGPEPGQYLLDGVDEMRVLFNAVVEMKAKARQAGKPLGIHPTNPELIDQLAAVPDGLALRDYFGRWTKTV